MEYMKIGTIRERLAEHIFLQNQTFEHNGGTSITQKPYHNKCMCAVSVLYYMLYARKQRNKSCFNLSKDRKWKYGHGYKGLITYIWKKHTLHTILASTTHRLVLTVSLFLKERTFYTPHTPVGVVCAMVKEKRKSSFFPSRWQTVNGR